MRVTLLYLEVVKGQTFAERLSNIMEARKLSIARVASAAEVDSQTIRRWMNGLTEPAFLPAMRLCDKLNIDPFLLAIGRVKPVGAAPGGETIDGAGEQPVATQADLQALRADFEKALEPLLRLVAKLESQED